MNHPPITSLKELETACHQLIPISKHMGMETVSYDGNALVLKAPLSNNINHQGSAFGGSLFSMCALVSWGIVQLKLGELAIEANTVVAGGEVSYSKPVFDALVCRCTLPESYQAFVAKLQKKGKASLTLNTEIILPEGPAMAFSGKFVVVKSKQA